MQNGKEDDWFTMGAAPGWEKVLGKHFKEDDIVIFDRHGCGFVTHHNV
jgi:hypothetical protein